MEVEGLSLEDWICFRRQDCGLQELREWIGNDGLLQFLEAFAGIYLKVPNAKILKDLEVELDLAGSYLRLKASKKANDLAGMVEAENRISHIAKIQGWRWPQTHERAKKAIQKLRKARAWRDGLEIWRKRHNLV
jgi:hypothetical protein